ncbi:MAG TPA: Gfo/Idh/MocA family oxidoreductase [bacterium]|nr:Gfo/Idh/MocA family oxidoreductase [bacterium]
MEKKIRVAVTEVSHWHSPEYLNGIQKTKQAELVAVSDRNGELARQKARPYGSRWYTDYQTMLEKEKPDFVFILGVHREMPAIIQAVTERAIPFCVEKPAAVSSAELIPCLEQVQKKDLYHSVPFVYRLSPVSRHLLEWHRAGLLGQWIALKFCFVTGPPERYRQWQCEWNLSKKLAGGGTTINLSVHYLDLFRYLTGEEIVHVKAVLSRKRFQEEVEDYSLVFLETNRGTIGEVETGYLSPPEERADRDTFVIYTEKRKITFRENVLGWKDYSGEAGEEKISSENPRLRFVEETLTGFSRGKPAIADLNDMLAVLRIIDRVYQNNH